MKMGYSNSLSSGRRKKPLVWTIVNENTDFSSYSTSFFSMVTSGWGEMQVDTTWNGSEIDVLCRSGYYVGTHYTWNTGAQLIPGGVFVKGVANMYRKGGSNITHARGPVPNHTSLTDYSHGSHAITSSPNTYNSYNVFTSNSWPGFFWCKNADCDSGTPVYADSDILTIVSYDVYKYVPDHYTTNYFAYNYSAGGDMIAVSQYYDTYLESDYQPEIGAHYRVKFYHTLNYGEEFSASMGGWNSGAITNHVATHYSHEFTATATDKFRITAAQGNTVKIGYIEIEKGE